MYKIQAHILLVEDDLELGKLYADRLESEGFDVRHARTGEDALQMAQELNPDLILLDIMMPGLDGFEVLDILRNTPAIKKAKIVVLSALSSPEDQQKAKDLGANDYLVKSQVLVSDVVERVRQVLGLPPKSEEPTE